MLYTMTLSIGLLYKLTASFRPMLKSIAFVCSKTDDGMSVEQVSKYIIGGDIYDTEFVSFCIQFAVQNKWLERKNEEDGYSLTLSGREFVSSQFG